MCIRQADVQIKKNEADCCVALGIETLTSEREAHGEADSGKKVALGFCSTVELLND